MSTNKSRIWLSSPHMGGEELENVIEVFESNWIAPLGPMVDGFEIDLQNYTGVKHAAALSSGTSAIHLALIILGVKPGDIVICQSMTFSASANPIAYLGATPVFIDSENETWNMNPDFLEMAIRDSITGKINGKPTLPKAIIPVHLYGMPAKMDEIIAIANSYNIPIVEDAAEALGSSYNNKKCGSFSDISILSFNGNKIITTSGGGALLSNNEEYVKKARFLATQARDQAPHYQHSNIGYNYRLSNVLAAIGRGQMQILDKRVEQKRKIFETYNKYFQDKNNIGYNVKFQPEMENSFSNRWLSCILVDPAENKNVDVEKIRLALAEDNIESRPLWKPMHMQPVFESCSFFGNNTAEYLFNNGLCLPSDSKMTENDFDRVFSVLDRIFV
ncbi:MAG: DegT/DnrJ/EryC1/StrS family aminotransferase [Lentimicrobiaceae bacterium]|nr:DegT/DnrJ/EryC1/StrS family aminotransferase [Lentimicrobiaceae bacterium]